MHRRIEIQLLYHLFGIFALSSHRNVQHLFYSYSILALLHAQKARYRQRITQRRADLINSGTREVIYQIDSKGAAIWVNEILETLQNEVVHNCWSKVTIV